MTTSFLEIVVVPQAVRNTSRMLNKIKIATIATPPKVGSPAGLTSTMISSSEMEIVRGRCEDRRRRGGSSTSKISGGLWSMKAVETMAQSAQPRQQLVFDGVGQLQNF